jgi:hypothetical protein
MEESCQDREEMFRRKILRHGGALRKLVRLDRVSEAPSSLLLGEAVRILQAITALTELREARAIEAAEEEDDLGLRPFPSEDSQTGDWNG